MKTKSTIFFNFYDRITKLRKITNEEIKNRIQ